MMTESEFWNVIEISRCDSTHDAQRENLVRILGEMVPEKLAAFSWFFGNRWELAYHDGLLQSAIILGFGCRNGMFHMNDGGFAAFADNLVSSGRESYYKIMENPDSVLDSSELLDCEERFLYTVVENILEERGLQEEASTVESSLEQRAHPEWDNTEFFEARLPRLYKLTCSCEPGFWSAQKTDA